MPVRKPKVVETLTIREANHSRTAIDKRLKQFADNSQDNPILIGFVTESKPLIESMNVEEAKKKMVSNLQSLKDLIIRRELLNKAVMDANTVVKVSVPVFNNFDKIMTKDTEEVSIAVAISRKKFYETLLSQVVKRMETHYRRTNTAYENKLTDNKDKVESLVQQVFANTETTNNASVQARLEYQKKLEDKYQVTLINPNDLYNLLQNTKDQLDLYLTKIDSIISHAMETHVIEIDDSNNVKIK